MGNIIEREMENNSIKCDEKTDENVLNKNLSEQKVDAVENLEVQNEAKKLY
jgi:hypothetical protein